MICVRPFEVVVTKSVRVFVTAGERDEAEEMALEVAAGLPERSFHTQAEAVGPED